MLRADESFQVEKLLRERFVCWSVMNFSLVRRRVRLKFFSSREYQNATKSYVEPLGIHNQILLQAAIILES